MKKEIKQNFVKLYYGLMSLPDGYDHFKMNSFFETPTNEFTAPADATTRDHINQHPCGSSACIIGHGPTFGVKPLRSENWTAYGNRCFCGYNEYIWDFLFSGEWDAFVSESQLADAIVRLEFFILNGFKVGRKTYNRVDAIFDSGDETAFDGFYDMLREKIALLRLNGETIPALGEKIGSGTGSEAMPILSSPNTTAHQREVTE